MAGKRTKVQELSIFTVGIGVILGALTLWFTYSVRPELGSDRSTLTLVVPLVVSVVLIILGVLTGILKSPAIINATMVFVALGFLLDMAIGLNVIKAVFEALVVVLVIKTGLGAVKEVKSEGKETSSE